MFRLADSPTELTTAATDALLGVACLAIVLWLAGLRPSWERGLWQWLFVLTAIGSFLGAFAHGFALSEPVRWWIWQPLYLSLGLAIALFVVAAVCDWRGEGAARALLPWALAVGVAFYLVTVTMRGAFGVFVAYEAVAMIAALVIYGLLTARGVPGSMLLALGVAITIAAAGVQASTLSARIVIPLDHNGLFHLVQLAGVALLAAGLRVTLS